MEPKKVLLIDPPWIIENKSNLWKNVGSCLPSLGLAYIASYLEKHNHHVKILDCTAEQISLDLIEEKLKKYDKPDFIGLTASTPLINNALEIAKIAKSLFPETKTILGGVHPSVLPGEVLSNPSVDFVVRDEGEETFKEIVEGKPPKDILGLSYKKVNEATGNTEKVHNSPRPLIKNLDEIPPPAYHLLPMDKYYPAIGNYKRLPAMSLFATRGCPGRCTFCHRAFRGIVRPRSAINIINEIKLLQKNYGIKEISFYDDTFTLFKKVVDEFCDIITKEKIDITWSCFTRVDHIEENLLSKMKKAGCHLILFGVETADKQIMKNINKNISLDQVIKVVKAARKIGIETRASFLFGNPGETKETIKKTIDFAIKLDPDEVQFNITTVYPGTEMYNWANEKGYILTKDWNKYNMSEIVMELPTIKPEELKEYYSLAHRKFYLRPKIIIRRLLRINSLTQLKQEIKGALAVFKL